MGYIDGFLLAIPNENKEAYKKICEDIAQLYLRHGALRVVECWGDDVPDGDITDFKRSVHLKPGETVVLSWIMWPDRKTRDEGGKRVHDEIAQMEPQTPPFDGKRMIWGGFELLFDSSPGSP